MYFERQPIGIPDGWDIYEEKKNDIFGFCPSNRKSGVDVSQKKITGVTSLRDQEFTCRNVEMPIGHPCGKGEPLSVTGGQETNMPFTLVFPVYWSPRHVKRQSGSGHNTYRNAVEDGLLPSPNNIHPSCLYYLDFWQVFLWEIIMVHWLA